MPASSPTTGSTSRCAPRPPSPLEPLSHRSLLAFPTDACSLLSPRLARLQIWSCLDDVPQQQWYYTDDGRIAVEGRGQCIDVRDGSRAPGAELQTWECSTGNGNQEFSTFRV
jgi:hypothetical protein